MKFAVVYILAAGSGVLMASVATVKDYAELAASILAIVGTITGAAIYIGRLVKRNAKASQKIADRLEEGTKEFKRIGDKVEQLIESRERQDEKLDAIDLRLAKIETRCTLNHPGAN